MIADSTWGWCLIPLQMNGPFKKEIYNSRLSHAALKQYTVIVSTQNDKMPDSSPKTPVQHLETISFVVCHQKSYTFHTFSSQLQNFPMLNSQTSFLYVSKPPFLSTNQYQPQTRPQSLATNHKITVDFPGNRTNYLVNHKERGVSFIPGTWYGYIIPWCSWGLTKTSLDDKLGWQIMSMYVLPHWPVSKHNQNTSQWKIWPQKN